MPTLGSGNYIGLMCETITVSVIKARLIISPVIALFTKYFNTLFIIKNGQIIGLTPFFITLIKKALCDDTSCCTSSSSSSSYYYCTDTTEEPEELEELDNVSEISLDLDDNLIRNLNKNNDFNKSIELLNDDEKILEKKIYTNKNTINNILYNNSPLTWIENIDNGTWIITGNILIKVPSNITWKNTNLKILVGESIIPNGELNFLNPPLNCDQKTGFVLNYTYNFIFNSSDNQDLSIKIEGNYIKNDNDKDDELPILTQSTNYFLTKLN